MSLLVVPPLLALFTVLGDVCPNGLTGEILTGGQADSICGRVISHDGDKSITIFDVDGERRVKLLAHGPLARGRIFPDVFGLAANGYLIRDVKVGDIVDLKIVKVGQYYRVYTIQIFERPGGFVPPSRIVPKDEKEGERYHDRRNAQIANKKFGVPLPEFMRPPQLKAVPINRDK